MQTQIYEHLDFPSCLTGIRGRIQDENLKSYEALAAHLQVPTRSKMKKFLKAESCMPKEVCDAFCEVGGLTSTEVTYVHLLRKIHFSSDTDQMLILTKKLIDIRKKNSKGITLDQMHETQVEVFSEWFLFPLTFYFPFERPLEVSSASLSKAFRGQVSPMEAWNGVMKLVELGLLVRVSENQFQRAKASLSLLDNSPRAVIRKFHQMMISKALETIELPIDRRFLTAATFSLKKDRLPELHQKMGEFLSEMITLYSDKEGESVHQLNMQCFSLMDK